MTITTTDYEKYRIRNHIDQLSAERILEIGAFKGETTRILCDAAKQHDGYVVVIDPMCWSSEVVRNGIARHLPQLPDRFIRGVEWICNLSSYEREFWANVGGTGRDDVYLYRALSTDPQLTETDDDRLAEFDLAFIDGDHSYEGARHDLETWGRRVRKGGRVLVHDADVRFPGVLRAIRDWSHDRRVDIEWPSRDTLCTIHVLEDLHLTAH